MIITSLPVKNEVLQMYAVEEQLFSSPFIFAWDEVPIENKALRYQLVASIDFSGGEDDYKDSGLLAISD